MARALLGKLLKDAGLVEDEQLRSALAHQGRWGCRLGEALLDLRIVRPPDLLAVLSMQLGVPALHIGLDRAISRHCGFIRPDALELPPEPGEPMRLVDGRVVGS